MMRSYWWLATVFLLCLPVAAQEDGSVAAEILCTGDGTLCREIVAKIELPGGRTADLSLSFLGADGLDESSLVLTAELVEPRDPQLRARLPVGTFIPDDFPVLLRIEPGDQSNFSFRQRWTLELVTDNLEFSSHSPTRLFKAPDGGAFQDISVGLGSGSVRVLAGGSDFSEFLVVSDLRPLAGIIRQKLDRLDAILSANAGTINTVIEELQGYVDQARTAFQNGDPAGAISLVGNFLEFIRADDGAEIPDITNLGDTRVNVAGLLLAEGATLRHSLFLGLQSAQGGMSGFSRSLVIDSEKSLDVTVRFEDSWHVDPSALELGVELIANVHDPDFLARFPADVQVPEEFPVLLRVTPDPATDQAFSGMYEIELVTENLSFRGGSPLRLFKAPDGGAFEDITQSLGLGSVRVLAGGSDFSEFVITRDQRPLATIVDAKLAHLENSFEVNGQAIPTVVRIQLLSQLAQVRSLLEQGNDQLAVDGLDQLSATILENSGEDIPSLWRSNESLSNIGGELRSLAKTLRFTLGLRINPFDADPADVNRDGVVDVQDVVRLINEVFGNN